MSFDIEIVDNDIKIKADGTISTLSDTPKLRQDVIKIILTPLSSNKFHPWYGCSVTESIAGRNMPANMVTEEIKTTISQSLDRLKTLQIAQAAGQSVSLAEMISAIGDIQSGRNPIDPRQINVIISVLTKRLTKIEEIFTLIS